MMLSQKMQPVTTDSSNVRNAAEFVNEVLSPGSHTKAMEVVTCYGLKTEESISSSFLATLTRHCQGVSIS